MIEEATPKNYVIRARYLDDEFVLTKHGVLEYTVGESPEVLVFNEYQEAQEFINRNFPRCRLFVSSKKTVSR